MPTARVMIYGYESGLQHNTSCVQLDDLASSLQIALSQLLRSERSKPLLLIAHSLGGLLVKEALIRIGDLDSGPGLLGMIAGLLFFGAPNDGMNIESLVPMVGDQPNRFLLESLSAMNAQILGLQRRICPSLESYKLSFLLLLRDRIVTDSSPGRHTLHRGKRLY